jgi:epoxyqueuosine reductase
MVVELKYSEGSAESEHPQWALEAHARIRSKGGPSPPIQPPTGVKRLLLHSCCAPCSGAMVEEVLASDAIEHVTVFFYNPNIHPRKEYEIRKEENKKYCQKLNIPFVDVDYDVDNWYARTQGMEFDPERGRRCTECFDMRMERAALYAHEHGFDGLATTNATSRWKDSEQVDASGERAASRYPNLTYWCRNWQTDEMTLRKYQIATDNHFYKQGE